MTAQDGRRLLLAACDDHTRDEWIGKIEANIKSFFFSPQQLKGYLDLGQVIATEGAV